MDEAEIRARNASIEAYRAKARLVRGVVWWSGLLAAVGVGLAVGYLWSFAAGIPLACVLVLLWLQGFLRLTKSAQIRRFPELGGEKRPVAAPILPLAWRASPPDRFYIRAAPLLLGRRTAYEAVAPAVAVALVKGEAAGDGRSSCRRAAGRSVRA
jgi:hypothetical protein